MVNPASQALAASILTHLQQVEAERAARNADADLSARVTAVKAYQRERFSRTHADLLAHPRYAAAARFFLDDLYGPHDFAERDAQFARIVPALVRLFPHEVVATVDSLAELHALSESLDSAMAKQLDSPGVDALAYRRAWQAVGRPSDRQRQVDLVMALGGQLDRYTRNRLLRHSLKLMRGPARAAGLASLQTFLERGFDTFSAMQGSTEFMALIERRELELIRALFDTAVVTPATSEPPALGQLP
ncbi:hypothetical protein AACH06_14645 [Ideonella sp. DXS29W]|uniref:DUF8198 domain-containing protein n=1 Tax=Ideonella lacteola TaxID=2984193 RepID=A0ABU9BQ27_9BURK